MSDLGRKTPSNILGFGLLDVASPFQNPETVEKAGPVDVCAPKNTIFPDAS